MVNVDLGWTVFMVLLASPITFIMDFSAAFKSIVAEPSYGARIKQLKITKATVNNFLGIGTKAVSGFIVRQAIKKTIFVKIIKL